jgi:predicted phosphodiesterase
VLVLSLVVAGCPGRRDSAPPPVAPVNEQPLKGGTDVTFFVIGDTHFGGAGVEATNRQMIAAMNALPGTAYPASIGGTVAQPRGVLHCGDVTDFGTSGQWSAFEKLYGLTGKEGELKFPIFECPGNHDRANAIGQTVMKGIERRHGGLAYSWNWDDVHFVCLDTHPTTENLAWLKDDLAKVGRQAPVVIFFHYTLVGFLSDMWSEHQKEALAEAIDGFNVSVIFTGHWHDAGRSDWKGYNVLRPGSPWTGTKSLIVVRITDRRVTAVYYDWGRSDAMAYVLPRWGEVLSKPLGAPPAARTATAAVAGQPAGANSTTGGGG